MNARKFYEEVKKMRRLQKAYFTHKTQLDLSLAKAQEKIIDDEISRVELLLAQRDGTQANIDFMAE